MHHLACWALLWFWRHCRLGTLLFPWAYSCVCLPVSSLFSFVLCPYPGPHPDPCYQIVGPCFFTVASRQPGGCTWAPFCRQYWRAPCCCPNPWHCHCCRSLPWTPRSHQSCIFCCCSALRSIFLKKSLSCYCPSYQQTRSFICLRADALITIARRLGVSIVTVRVQSWP